MTREESKKNLGAALGRIPSGVFILALANDKFETGMLASWAQQCSFDPPMISFAVQRGRPLVDLLQKGMPFALNILEASQTDMIAHFGKGFPLEERPFAKLSLRQEPGWPPILSEALAYLAGNVTHAFPAGDHDIYVGEIKKGSLLNTGAPMVHVRKNGFHY